MADLLSVLFGLGSKDKAEIKEIDIEDIEVSPYQPREVFDEKSLTELSQSINEFGVIQPIIVRKRGLRYELIAGERRLRAAKLAQLKTIPAIIRKLDDEQSLALALVENLQREDLNPIEEATVYLKLIQELKLNQRQVAEKLGKSPHFISQMIRILQLPELVKKDVSHETISKGHCFALLKLKNIPLQEQVLKEIKTKSLSVKQTEGLVSKLLLVGIEKQSIQLEQNDNVQNNSEQQIKQTSAAKSIEVTQGIKEFISKIKVESKVKIKMKKFNKKNCIEIRIIIPK